MANRVTAEEVIAILSDCNATTPQVDALLTTANIYITNVFSGVTVDSTLLKELEKWFTAHLVSITHCRTIKNEELGDAKVNYAGMFGTKLSMTQYGQMVLQLDTTGEIMRKGKTQASVIAITSFNE